MNPKFAAEDLEKFRANKIRELTVSRAQPGTVAWEKFREVVYPNHPYGVVSPSEESVKVTISKALNLLQRQLRRGANASYVVGQFDAAVKSTIERAFGKWKKGADRFATCRPARRNAR
jgi:predicted Zn-dependent peptidase